MLGDVRPIFRLRKEIGNPYRVTIEEEDTIKFDDNYSPSSWNVSFFTNEDYKKYQSSENTVESSAKSSTSDTKASNSSQAEDKNDIYSDSYIKVTRNGGTLSIKNLSTQDIKMKGNVTFNNSKEVNLYDFGYIGDIKKDGVVTQLISKVTLMDEGEPGDKEDGETLGGNKTFIHNMKKGETLLWTGEIKDSEYNTLAQISFNIEY